VPHDDYCCRGGGGGMGSVHRGSRLTLSSWRCCDALLLYRQTIAAVPVKGGSYTAWTKGEPWGSVWTGRDAAAA